jgi:hypothetical protein
MKDFINYDDMYECIKNIYIDALDEDEASKYEDEIECHAEIAAQDAAESMRKYVHRKDTRMDGNFCNIREDWECCPEFIGSDVKPWGKFDDMVKSLDDETISDYDLKKVQQWCMDWYFRAFGTFGLKYNFQSYISELEYEEECCAVSE